MATVQELLTRTNGPSKEMELEEEIRDKNALIKANEILQKKMDDAITVLEDGMYDAERDFSHFEIHLHSEFNAKFMDLKARHYRLSKQNAFPETLRDPANTYYWMPDRDQDQEYELEARDLLDMAFKEGQAALIGEARKMEDPTTIFAIIWQVLDTLSHDPQDLFGKYDKAFLRRNGGDPDTLRPGRTRLKRALIKVSKAMCELDAKDSPGPPLYDTEGWEFRDGQLVIPEGSDLYDCIECKAQPENDKKWVEVLEHFAGSLLKLWDPTLGQYGHMNRLFSFFQIRAGQTAMDYIFPCHSDVPRKDWDLSVESIRNAFLSILTGHMEAFRVAIIPWDSEKPDGKRYKVFYLEESLRNDCDGMPKHMQELNFLTDFRPSARLLYWHYLKCICHYRNQLEVNKPGNKYDDVWMKDKCRYPGFSPPEPICTLVWKIPCESINKYESSQTTYRLGVGDPLRVFERFGNISSGKTEVILANEPKEEYDISHFYDFARWPKRVKGDFGKTWKYWGSSGKWIRKSVLEHINTLMKHPIADADPEVHGIPDEPKVRELKRVARDINIGLHHVDG